MGTPLYNTDIIPLTSRPTLTVMDDGDYFVILDTSTGKISKILKTNIMTALKITYDNTSGLTAETVQAALDELVVNLGSSDGAILALAGRLNTLEGTGEGSVKKAIDDALEPIEEDITDHESRIELLEGLQPLETWEDVQKVAKAGFASKYLKAGDLIETTYDGSPAVVEVVGINQDTPPEGTTDYKDVISFQFKDCLQNAQYSAPQALFNAVEGLSAGTYTFVNSYTSLPYTFTLTQSVPAGGVIVITSWGEPFNPLVIKTMQAESNLIRSTFVAPFHRSYTCSPVVIPSVP